MDVRSTGLKETILAKQKEWNLNIWVLNFQAFYDSLSFSVFLLPVKVLPVIWPNFTCQVCQGIFLEELSIGRLLSPVTTLTVFVMSIVYSSLGPHLISCNRKWSIGNKDKLSISLLSSIMLSRVHNISIIRTYYSVHLNRKSVWLWLIGLCTFLQTNLISSAVVFTLTAAVGEYSCMWNAVEKVNCGT